MDAATLLFLVLAALLVALGLAGLVLPAMPGPPLLLAGLFLAAWAEGFAYVGGWTLVALTGLAALTYAADFAASAIGARRFGASRRAVVGAVIGAFVGIFFGLPGILLGPLVGAVIGELSAHRGLREAGRAGLGATLGMVLGAALKLGLGFTMVGVFALARLN